MKNVIVKVNVAKTTADNGIVLRVVIPKEAYQYLKLQKGDYVVCSINQKKKCIEYRKVKT